ncbi:hypothetical protein CYMTET_48775 [Cymbomonas tetramitiformis]|uniref:Uncharacterized protein n=1 Tax=Cymbomonas tetramitiformis TaxID=36881 RepID=A0AAE0BSP0_9CHLO|nr:hypothetical protein CYMTET_48775 [Cymbomonas tetramitiformis]
MMKKLKKQLRKSPEAACKLLEQNQRFATRRSATSPALHGQRRAGLSSMIRDRLQEGMQEGDDSGDARTQMLCSAWRELSPAEKLHAASSEYGPRAVKQHPQAWQAMGIRRLRKRRKAVALAGAGDAMETDGEMSPTPMMEIQCSQYRAQQQAESQGMNSETAAAIERAEQANATAEVHSTVPESCSPGDTPPSDADSPVASLPGRRGVGANARDHLAQVIMQHPLSFPVSSDDSLNFTQRMARAGSRQISPTCLTSEEMTDVLNIAAVRAVRWSPKSARPISEETLVTGPNATDGDATSNSAGNSDSTHVSATDIATTGTTHVSVTDSDATSDSAWDSDPTHVSATDTAATSTTHVSVTDGGDATSNSVGDSDSILVSITDTAATSTTHISATDDDAIGDSAGDSDSAHISATDADASTTHVSATDGDATSDATIDSGAIHVSDTDVDGEDTPVSAADHAAGGQGEHVASICALKSHALPEDRHCKHIRKDGTIKWRYAARSRLASTLAAVRDDDGPLLLVFYAYLRGHMIKVLVDSGASDNFVSEECAKRCNLTIRKGAPMQVRDFKPSPANGFEFCGNNHPEAQVEVDDDAEKNGTAIDVEGLRKEMQAAADATMDHQDHEGKGREEWGGEEAGRGVLPTSAHGGEKEGEKISPWGDRSRAGRKQGDRDRCTERRASERRQIASSQWNVRQGDPVEPRQGEEITKDELMGWQDQKGRSAKNLAKERDQAESMKDGQWEWRRK